MTIFSKRLPSMALGALLVLTSACGLSHTVDRELLVPISVEYKLSLFEAENDLSIAADEREKIIRMIRQRRKDISAVEIQIDDAAGDLERADLKGNDQAADVAIMAQEVFALKMEYLEGDIEYLFEKLDGQNDLVNVAVCRYELAKAELVKKHNVRGAEDMDVLDFEDQVEDYIERAQDARADLAEEAEELEAVKQIWLDRRAELEKASGGGVGSQWAEDSSLWGGR